MIAEENPELWGRILVAIAAEVSPGPYETWFLPLRASAPTSSTLEITFPNEAFQASFCENYRDLLLRVAGQVAGADMKIGFFVRAPGTTCSVPGACDARAEPLPVVRASELKTPECRQSWLIEHLWSHQAVGIIGGSPKSGKTWLALEIAVSVASGSPCLNTFAVSAPGPVLLYAAEDPATALRDRVQTLAQVHGVDFRGLDLHIITIDALRLDRPDHQDRLEATLQAYRPALLILDPLVRVHAIDENIAGQVAALLGYLRSLQRKTGAAIALVHHVRKNASATAGAGNSLRGSGDLYAWVDSFLYLRSHQGQRLLSAEHRSAPAFGPVALELVQAAATGTYLKIASAGSHPSTPTENGLASRIVQLLTTAPEPLTIENLRSHLQVRNQRVVEAIRELAAQGRIQRQARGFALPTANILPI
jgi:hypothetical protein